MRVSFFMMLVLGFGVENNVALLSSPTAFRGLCVSRGRVERWFTFALLGTWSSCTVRDTGRSSLPRR